MSKNKMRTYNIGGETYISNMDMNEEELKETADMFHEIYDKPTDYYDINYITKATHADNEKDRIKYAKKALKEDPDCLEAKVLLAKSKNRFEAIKELEEILEEEKDRLIKIGILKKKNVGSFALTLEGMLYIDAMYELMLLYMEINGFKRAIYLGEEIMRLDSNYMPHLHSIVVSLYAYFEDEQRINKICKNCGRPCIIYFISMMTVYYKKGNFKKAQEYLDLINRTNSCFIPYFKGKRVKGEEADVVLNIVKDFNYLFDSTPYIDEFIKMGGNI